MSITLNISAYFSKFLDPSVGYHRLDAMQWIEIRRRVYDAFPVLPTYRSPREHFAMLSEPSLRHHADVLTNLRVSQPPLFIDLHRLLNGLTDHDLHFRLRLLVHQSRSNMGMIPCFFSSSYRNLRPACVHSV